MPNKKLFIVLNVDYFLLSHRKELSVAAKYHGYDVTVIALDTGKKNEIENLGLRFRNFPINRNIANPLKELKSFLFILSIYMKEKPAIVHHVGLKVVLMGGLAAKLAKIRGVVNAISGLGITFSDENIKSVSTKLYLRLLKFSHSRKNIKVIFQNHEDKSIFINNKVIAESQSETIKGSGIDLDEFNYTPEPSGGKIKIVFSARMIAEKGVFELIQAANLLKSQYKSKIQFLLCGGIDINPKAISKKELNTLCDGEYIVWLGYRTDVKEIIKNSHIFAFPSYYMEGLPKSLIEAAAIGKPIVTTDSIGCKDVVKDGYNGFLIPTKDSTSLADCLKELIDNKELRKQFGLNSRKIAERDFSIKDVVSKHLSIYSSLNSNF